METAIYYCPICGNVIVKLQDSGVTPSCCGETMECLVANTSEGLREKHIPVVSKDGEGKIKIHVGSVAHPMENEHYIQFLLIVTRDRMCRYGWTFAKLYPGNMPEYTFTPHNATVAKVYAYCNIHGLWEVNFEQKNSCKLS